MAVDRFWEGRRVLITGHTGFIGSWLALALNHWGAQVTGLALPPLTSNDHYTVARVEDRLDSCLADLRDAAATRDVVTRARPQIVFHLAAQSLVLTAHDDPTTTFATNVMGTVNLLEAIRHTETVRAVVAFTTDKVYVNQEWPWPYRETDILGGLEPYGASKAAVEHVIEAYRQSYFGDSGVGVAVVRAGNVVGGGDWATNRLIPDAMRAFADGTVLHIRNPAAVRPWQHVLEPVGASLLLGQHLLRGESVAGQAWNVGPAPGDSLPVSQIADRLVALWSGALPWTTGTHPEIYEAHRLFLDSSKLQTEFGWRPRWSLDRALGETVAWYRRHHAGDTMADVSRQQVRTFLDER